MQTLFAWSWWQTPDQAGSTYMKKRQYEKAMKNFDNLDWKATAAYRAQKYQEAADLYRLSQDIEARYNLGNALAKLHHYDEAIAAFDAVLQKNPEHQDARFNRDLLKNHKQKEQKQSSNAAQKPQQNQSSQKKSSTSPSSSTSHQTPPTKNPEEKKQSTIPRLPHQGSSQKKTPQSKTSPVQQTKNKNDDEKAQAQEKWLKLIPDDPGGLLKQQFLRDHLRRLYPENGDL